MGAEGIFQAEETEYAQAKRGDKNLEGSRKRKEDKEGGIKLIHYL